MGAFPDGLARRRDVGPEDVDPEELERGIQEEMEHTSDPEIAEQIALDHLTEDPEYYTKLARVMREDERDDENYPPKLLECPVLGHLPWPSAWEKVGDALRFDYSSALHEPDWVPYKHRFTTGVSVLVPSDAGVPVGEERSFPRPFEPVAMGYADRLYLVTEDGERQAFLRDGLDLDDESHAANPVEYELDADTFAWDPSGRRLLVLGDGNRVRFLLEGDLLQLDDDAMIVG